MTERVRSWVRRRPVAWCGGILAIALVLGSGIGAAAASEEDKVDELEAQLTGVKRTLAQTKGDLVTTEASLARIEGLKGRIVGSAEKRADAIVGAARREKESAEGSLSSLTSEVETTQRELENVEASLNGVEETQAKSTIPGNGTFKAEVDYIPGTYRAAGGPGCYWATLNSADPYDIASNENASGPTIASITTPYFQTDGCGRWERIGE
jgi:hypothetical protein